MTDVAEELGISQTRADALNRKCFKTIAKWQKDVGKIVENLSAHGKNDKEKFYIGFAFGRLVQVDAFARGDETDFVQHQLGELAKAKDALNEHPEFG